MDDRRKHDTACWYRHHDCAVERLVVIQDLHVVCWATPLAEGGCSKADVSDPDHVSTCMHCGMAWPCPTSKAVQGRQV